LLALLLGAVLISRLPATFVAIAIGALTLGATLIDPVPVQNERGARRRARSIRRCVARRLRPGAVTIRARFGPNDDGYCSERRA